MTGVKTILGVLALLMVLMGGIWILQGVNTLPGSYMTGDMHWTYRGAALAGVGAVLLIWTLRTSGMWRNILGALGALLAMIGLVWALHALGVLPGPGGSRGQSVWIMRGAICALIGLVLIFVATRASKAAS